MFHEVIDVKGGDWLELEMRKLCAVPCVALAPRITLTPRIPQTLSNDSFKNHGRNYSVIMVGLTIENHKGGSVAWLVGG